MKFWIVSLNILLLPIIVCTLSGVLMVVVNRPSSVMVPVTPATVTKSPTFNGRNTTRKAPAAKCASRPDHAIPMATPAAAISAAKVVVWMPK